MPNKVYADETIKAILGAPLPSARRDQLRREPRKVWAQEVRSLLKSLGIQGVSVTAPSYAQAHSIDIQLPIDHHGDATHDFHTCSRCRQSVQAKRHLEEIILAAFPDLNDRSEYGTDYYDFCLSIN